MSFNLFRRFQSTNTDQPLGGRYKIERQLGIGGFGQTFLAQDLHLPGHPQCVIKQLKPKTTDPASLETARRLFDTEAQVLYQLGNHDQIPRLLAHFEENQEFYLAQELILGNPLTQELKKGQQWLESKTIALLQDILQVLAYVHEQNVIHRDIKPSNLIRRQPDGKIVLIDFGAVKQVTTQFSHPQSGQTNLTISIGTQGYVPKEQLGGQPRFSSDVYAVGLLGIQALTGTHPRLLRENPETGEIQWRDLAPHVSLNLAEILDQMIRYDFRDRYQTATEALNALQRLSSDIPASDTTQRLPDSSDTTASIPGSTSTQIWTPTHPPTPSPSTTSSTQLPETWRNSQPASGSSVPTIVTPGSNPKRGLNLWWVVAILGIVGGTAGVATTRLIPQFTSKTTNQSQELTVNSANSATQPSPTSSLDSSPTEETTTNPSSDSKSPTSEQPTPDTPKTGEQPSPVPSPESTPSPSVKKSPPVTQNPAPPKPATPTPTPLAPKPTKVQPTPSPVPSASPSPNTANAKTHWQRCYDLNTQQRPQEAIQACDRALAINPDYPEALWSKGAALDQLGRHQEALNLYEKATTLKPDFAEAWINQGVALILLGQPEKAIPILDRAIQLKPNSANAWINKAEAYMELERYDDAIASLKKALEIQPNNEYAATMLIAAEAKK
ncbi:tetratricopeptide repeat domain protein [Coleofasciculus chthonoplastes PCC 7420]|uniref:non-specific serine/threonine protein kinase n=1 Tax=Coleofasciculus chthonoplastes PCC 7420 TaxID=118168 RepID=B4VIY5_9CYAN|nr:serine/threonine-protein kinase [Coleofasciculus chthonoplastes]EDX78310.1 tetratricopeptide repeat domain protein [Coleofasciculus chthonoplastes PCC 7420]